MMCDVSGRCVNHEWWLKWFAWVVVRGDTARMEVEAWVVVRTH